MHVGSRSGVSMKPLLQYVQVLKKLILQSQQSAVPLLSVQEPASRHCCEQSRVHIRVIAIG